MRLEVKADTLGLLTEFRKLRKAVPDGMQSIAHYAAAALLEELRNRYNDAGQRERAAALRIKKIQGEPAHYGVFLPAVRKFLPSSDTKSVISVVPTAKGAKTDWVMFLVENGPWTLDTLPAEPQRALATLYTEEMVSDDVTEIRTRRLRTRTETTEALKKMGAVTRSPTSPLRYPVTEKTSLVARREEIGMLGRRIWGPSVRASTVVALRGIHERLLEGALPVGVEPAGEDEVTSASAFARSLGGS